MKLNMKIKISHNGFHGHTSAIIQVNGRPGDRVRLTPSQVARLKPMACGCSDCKCGESLLAACEDEARIDGEYWLHIPESGEIEVQGNYPQTV